MTERGEDIIRQVERKRRGAKPGPKPKRKKPEGSGRKPMPPELKRSRLMIRLSPEMEEWVRDEMYRRVVRYPARRAAPTPSDVITDALDLYRGQGIDWRKEFEELAKALWVLGDTARTMRQDFRISRAGLPGDVDGILESLVTVARLYEQGRIVEQEGEA